MGGSITVCLYIDIVSDEFSEFVNLSSSLARVSFCFHRFLLSENSFTFFFIVGYFIPKSLVCFPNTDVLTLLLAHRIVFIWHKV